MDLTKTVKDIVWTGGEITVIIGGAAIAEKFLGYDKIFKKHIDQHPEWFAITPNGQHIPDKHSQCPWYIKWSEAGGALFAIQHVKNPWLKLGLMGVAFKGILQTARIATMDEQGHTKIPKIGASESERLKKLDDQLKNLANEHRSEMNGPLYLEGPEYLGAYDNNYSTQVAGVMDEMGNPMPEYGGRYKTQVAGIFDEGDYHYRSSDNTQAH